MIQGKTKFPNVQENHCHFEFHLNATHISDDKKAKLVADMNEIY